MVSQYRLQDLISCKIMCSIYSLGSCVQLAVAHARRPSLLVKTLLGAYLKIGSATLTITVGTCQTNPVLAVSKDVTVLC